MRRFTAAGWLGLGLLVAACGGGGEAPPAGPTFVIESSVPAANATVGLSADVRVTFSMPLDPATLGANSLAVTSAKRGAVPGTTVLVSDGTGRTLHWAGTEPFAPEAIHTCRVHAAVRAGTGEALGGDGYFNFRTGSGGSGTTLPDPRQLRATAGAMGRGRQGHEATLLLDGRVLVSGGFTLGLAITDRAEVYLPDSETFGDVTPPMTSGRAGHTATRLADGRVLLAGGWFVPSPGQLATTATAELFDPATNDFVAVGDMTKARVDHAALLLPDGRVLVTGGSRLDGSFLTDFDDAEIFDPGTLSFTAHPARMLHTRSSHGMVDQGGGRFLLAGGSDLDLRLSWFDTVLGTFTDLGSVTGDQARFGPAVAVFANGGATVAGGDVSGTVLFVRPDTGQVLNTGSGLDRPRAYATATRIADDWILVVGGTDFSRGGFLEASCDLVVAGGIGGSTTYATAVRFPHGMSGHTATVLQSGDVLYCGGQHPDGTQANHADAFLFLRTAP